MSDQTPYMPSLDEARELHVLAADTTNADVDNGAAFDRLIAQVRAETLRGAAEAVHAEARWQQENIIRGAVQKSGAQTAVERLLVVEQLLRQQADYFERGEQGWTFTARS